MQITRLRIKNYRAIAALDEKIPPKGAIAKGGNGRGKTTVLRAIRAALVARDVGPDAIRDGADKAEIFVDLDDVTVKRIITKTASTVSVETSARDRKIKPQNYLNEILGTTPLDPLDLFLAKPRERRAMVLAALPAKVTNAEFDAWVPEWARVLVPEHVRGVLDQLHGIDACAALHKVFYDQRAEANASTKAAKAEADQLAKQVDEIAAELRPGALSREDAGRRAENARSHLAELDARKRRAEEQGRRVSGARDAIAELRTKAAAERDAAQGAPTAADVLAAHDERAEAERAFEAARVRLDVARAKVSHLSAREENAARAIRRCDDLNRQADELERTIGAITETAPTDDDFAAARVEVDEAQNATLHAALAERVREQTAKAERAKQSADDLAQRAADLTGVVDFLRVDAPRELIAKSQGIPGLGLEGDDLTLDGKSIDAVSGREQMIFAVEVARRANAKTKFLVVDGLERLDPDALPLFVDAATRDGFQLIATRVDRGEMVIDAIQPTTHEEAAE